MYKPIWSHSGNTFWDWYNRRLYPISQGNWTGQAYFIIKKARKLCHVWMLSLIKHTLFCLMKIIYAYNIKYVNTKYVLL